MSRWRSGIGSWWLIWRQLIEVKFSTVYSMERLFIPVPIGIAKLKLTAVIRWHGPAVRVTAPRAYDLRLAAIVESASATCACIHLALLSVFLRRLSGNQLGLERRGQSGHSGHETALFTGDCCVQWHSVSRHSKIHSPYGLSPTKDSMRCFGHEARLILNAVLVTGMTTP
jgi:hypothetical protein